MRATLFFSQRAGAERNSKKKSRSLNTLGIYQFSIHLIFYNSDSESNGRKNFKTGLTNYFLAYVIFLFSKFSPKLSTYWWDTLYKQGVSWDRFSRRTHAPRTSRSRFARTRARTPILWWSHFAPAPAPMYHKYFTHLHRALTYCIFSFIIAFFMPKSKLILAKNLESLS